MPGASCSVEGCSASLLAKGLCKVHYDRKRRHGSPLVNLKPLSPRGAPLKWLEANSDYTGEECLIWPFARFPDGRAHMAGAKPARIMCELKHGKAPSPIHQAAHSCGKANTGCVSPGHLRWATPVENAADKVTHGTVVQGEAHYASKLTEADVRAIRALAETTSQRDLANLYGVKFNIISKVVNRQAWRHVT